MADLPPIYELGPAFYDVVEPAQFPQRILRYRNQEAAQTLGLAELGPNEWLAHLGEFQPFAENISRPLALRYHGHQFMHYNPDLGDGRGFLFAQFLVPESRSVKLYDLGTKGSGQTPYSRRGDGRLTLKGAFREILATELLQSYGVNTSRTLSVIETGEHLERHDEPSPTRAAVLVRMCHSHIRFGTFQRLAYLQEKENIQKLTEYSLRHYFPEIAKLTGADATTSSLSPTARAQFFFEQVVQVSADLVASWVLSGFVHGVMNTDNMNITGECFDYGPYRFLPSYNPDFVAAYFDQQGLYSFGHQPRVMHWNLEQLGKSLQVGYPDLQVANALESFGAHFNSGIEKHLLRRLNLVANEKVQDLISAFFDFLLQTQAAYEQTFFDLFSGIQEARLARSPQAEIYQQPAFAQLREQLSFFKIKNPKLLEHPYFQQPRACSLLIDELEKIWEPIAAQDDWGLFEKKLAEIRSLRGIY